ncbi:hypothetical protein [Cyanobium sp. NIES-981]|uniref:hypothetical protein n=1 Tax=Cyanobium sp. NIES-981 TaxID=1851505 RepID=UPI0007DD78E7|nr:hypothetical protein [Cyanobium sp. NIES-981]SBO44968.1 protein of unknown function [Cyanobium sp. NIES-981]
MTQFFLHIGTHKTGSTALQNYLFNNQAQLLKLGICYPRQGLHNTGHHNVAWSAAKGKIDELQAYITAIVESSKASQISKVILSSEEFEFVRDPQLLRRLLPSDTTIILYLRRPDTYLESEFSQHVRMYDLRFSGDIFRFYFRVNFLVRCDYLRLCKTWSDAFGTGNLRIVSYDQARSTNSLYSSMNQLLGIDPKETLKEPSESESNIGMTAPAIYYLSKLNNENLTKTQHFRLMSEIASHFSSLPRQSLLEYADRMKLYNRISRDVKTLETHFKVKLFDPPSSKKDDGREFCDYSSLDSVLTNQFLSVAKSTS